MVLTKLHRVKGKQAILFHVPGFARQSIGASKPDHSTERNETNFCDFYLQILQNARNLNSSIIFKIHPSPSCRVAALSNEDPSCAQDTT